MNLKNQLEEQLKNALRNKDVVRKNVIRMALSSIKMAELDQRKELEDAVFISILQKEVKTREETIAEAKNANRSEMIAPLEEEITVLKEFLPPEFNDEELSDFLKNIIQDSGAASIRDMGLVMKIAIQQSGGRASNDRISRFVREFFSE